MKDEIIEGLKQLLTDVSSYEIMDMLEEALPGWCMTDHVADWLRFKENVLIIKPLDVVTELKLNDLTENLNIELL
jgi:hypothetical protein